jgi:hypothetical protein
MQSSGPSQEGTSEDALIEINVIDLGTPNRLKQKFCDQIRYFNYTDSSGGLIQGVDVGQTGQPKQNELTTAVEDGLLIAI